MTNDTPALDASVQSTIDHLNRLVAKRDKINDSIGDAYDALMSAVVRNPPTDPAAAVDLYRWARGLRATDTPQPHSRLKRMGDAVGYSVSALRHWAAYPEQIPADSAMRGTFPVFFQNAPKKGVPTVYVLLADGVVIYIGRSQDVKNRLKAHWYKRDEKPGLDGWAIYRCGSQDEAVRLELDLIRQYAPRHNKQGNPFRTVA